MRRCWFLLGVMASCGWLAGPRQNGHAAAPPMGGHSRDVAGQGKTPRPDDPVDSAARACLGNRAGLWGFLGSLTVREKGHEKTVAFYGSDVFLCPLHGPVDNWFVLHVALEVENGKGYWVALPWTSCRGFVFDRILDRTPSSITIQLKRGTGRFAGGRWAPDLPNYNHRLNVVETPNTPFALTISAGDGGQVNGDADPGTGQPRE
jgi:hypothetical protein